MTNEEFIEKYIKITQKGNHIKLTPLQHTFLNWIEKCKRKGLKPFNLKGKGKV